MSLVLRAIAAQARESGRVPYVDESTSVHAKLGGQHPVSLTKDVVGQVIGDVRAALKLTNKKNDGLAKQAYNFNPRFFQELAAGDPPPALSALPEFMQHRL